MHPHKIETIFTHSAVGITTFYFTYIIKDLFHYRDNLRHGKKIETLQHQLEKEAIQNKPITN